MSKSTALLGAVSQDGVIRYHSKDINDCRTFLRGLGLDVGMEGWAGKGMLGILEYSNHRWNCAAWQSTACAEAA